MIGTTLAHYRITAALGSGGMGEVKAERGEPKPFDFVPPLPIYETIDTRGVTIAGRFAAADGYGPRSRCGHQPIGRDAF